MARKIIAANWKMNLNLAEGQELIQGLIEVEPKVDSKDIELVIGVPFTHLFSAATQTKESAFQIASQDCSLHQSGAFTGEISLDMIKSTGAEYVILGHSERRTYWNESDEDVNSKLKSVLEFGLKPIVCVGETLDLRKSNQQNEKVSDQLTKALAGLTASDLKSLVIAYEPVWAIGTGEVASPEQAQEMHLFIRDFLKNCFNSDLADQTPILYGGSLKPSNADDLFAKNDVDGGLIGGASLKVEDFSKLIESRINNL